MSRARVWLLLGLWVLLGLIVAGEARVLHVRVDLDFAIPQPDSPEAEVVATVLRRGSAASPIAIAVRGGDEGHLAQLSEELSAALVASGHFRYVLNGANRLSQSGLAAIFEWRYLLNPPLDADYFTPAALRLRTSAALERLAGVEGMALRPLLPADPTLRVLDVAAAWSQSGAQAAVGTPWFSRDRSAALLVAGPRLAMDDFEAAGALVRGIQNTFGSLESRATSTLQLSGPIVFTVEAADLVRKEIAWLTAASMALVALIVLLTYRSFRVLGVVALPAAFGACAGAAVVQLVHGEVHGITLAFGSTVLGIAVDYPIHMLSHSRAEMPLRRATAMVWSTVLLGVVTTAAAFAPILWSSVPGLSQLGLFAIAGIVTAGLLSRVLLPVLLPEYAAPPIARLWGRSQPRRARGARYAGVVAVAILAAIVVARWPAPWQNDLLSLSPTSSEQLALDGQIRADVGGNDVRYLLAVRGATPDDVLQATERLATPIAGLVRAGSAAGAEMPSLFLPSLGTQRQRQVTLPVAETLRPALATAVVDLGVREGTFAPFVAGVEQNRTRAPITLQDFEAADLDWLLDPLLFADQAGWVGLVVPRGLADPSAWAALAERSTGALFIDLRVATESIVAAFRAEALFWLPLGLLLGTGIMFASLKSLRATARTVLPVLVSLGVSVAILLLVGEQLSPFHLLALIVIAGLAVDYALILGLHAQTPDDWGRSLRGVAVSALTTAVPFSVLALSAIPVLHQIGLTVALGTLSAFAFAYLLHDRSAPWQPA